MCILGRYLQITVGAVMVVVLLALCSAAPASAASSPAYATPGTFSCEAATAANKVTVPPPIWELSGKTPNAQEVAIANSTTPLCQAGQVPPPIAHGPAVPDLMPSQTEVATGRLSTSSGLNTTGDSSIAPPAYGGQGCTGGGCYWYAQNEQAKAAIGMEYSTNISEPYVSSWSGNAHSIDQLAVGAGTEGNQYTIEAGFDVDPDMFGSSPKPHFFIFVNPDQYGSESCYDCNFVPAAEAKLTPGETLEPSTAKITLGVKYTGGNWWIWAGTQWIGYVPGSAWGGHFTKGSSEANYGEVFDNEEFPTSGMAMDNTAQARARRP